MSDSDLPTLYCPFQSTVSPHAAIVDQRTIDWARAFGLITNDAIGQRFQAARFGWLAAYLAPIDRYAALLRSFMFGNLAWFALSGRYGLAQEFQA